MPERRKTKRCFLRWCAARLQCGARPYATIWPTFQKMGRERAQMPSKWPGCLRQIVESGCVSMTIFRYPMLCWRFWQSVHSGYASKDQKKTGKCLFFFRAPMHTHNQSSKGGECHEYVAAVHCAKRPKRAHGHRDLSNCFTHTRPAMFRQAFRGYKEDRTPLYIWDGDRLRQWEMRHNGRELRLQVKRHCKIPVSRRPL